MGYLAKMCSNRMARALAAALVLGVTALGLTTGQADAARKREDLRCREYIGNTGSYTIYYPGEIVVVSGMRFQCGDDGQWHQVG